MSTNGRTSAGATATPAARQPWYLRRQVLLGGAVAVIVAIAVVTDLPTAQSRASNVAGANAFIQEVNTDLKDCTYAVTQAYGIRANEVEGTILPSEQTQLPALLNDDDVACTYADPNIEDLTTGIESPGTSVANELGQAMAVATQWAAYDGVRAISSIETLTSHPHDTKASSELGRDTVLLVRDRRRARAWIDRAEHLLGATLDQLSLPDVATSMP